MNYEHLSNWSPVVKAWVAMTGDQYDQIHESTGGIDGDGRDTMVLKNEFFIFHFEPGTAIAEAAKLKIKEKKPVVICALGFSEVTCINALQCVLHGDSMDFPVTVVERLEKLYL